VQFKLQFLVKCRIGSGQISACGGSGFAGGGGGRVAVDVFSRHEEPVIFAYGMSELLLLFFCNVSSWTHSCILLCEFFIILP
jgi:hypothetical protein